MSMDDVAEARHRAADLLIELASKIRSGNVEGYHVDDDSTEPWEGQTIRRVVVKVAIPLGRKENSG